MFELDFYYLKLGVLFDIRLKRYILINFLRFREITYLFLVIQKIYALISLSFALYILAKSNVHHAVTPNFNYFCFSNNILLYIFSF